MQVIGAPVHGTAFDCAHLLVSSCMWLERCSCVPASGVFSMDGHIAPLPDICALARKYGALVFVVRACTPARRMGICSAEPHAGLAAWICSKRMPI